MFRYGIFSIIAAKSCRVRRGTTLPMLVSGWPIGSSVSDERSIQRSISAFSVRSVGTSDGDPGCACVAAYRICSCDSYTGWPRCTSTGTVPPGLIFRNARLSVW